MADSNGLLALLVRAVRDGLVTEGSAAAFLQAGVTTDFPTPPEEAVRGLADEEVSAGLDRANVVRLLPSGRDGAREQFHVTAARYANGLASGTYPLARWQEMFAGMIGQHLVTMYAIGAGVEALTPAERAPLDAAMRRETAYLSRFADQLAIANLYNAPMSAAGIAARSELYEGSAYAAYWQGKEQGPRDGWVAYYRARDDVATCSACGDAAANGPYLPLDGPMPGDACIAGGRCRCERELVYDPSAAADLGGTG